MKARFTEQQPAVKIVKKDETAYVYICANEEQVSESYPDMGEGQTTVTYYEYDYNEIVGPSEELPLEDIRVNPYAYLKYEYRKSTLEERLEALENNQKDMNRIFEEVVNSEATLL